VIVVPASALESMNLGAIGGISAIAEQAGDGRGKAPENSPPATV